MQFAKRIRNGVCVICGDKYPLEDLKIQNIQMPAEDQIGGFFYHNKCIPKVSLEFSKAMINCVTLEDINDVLNS